MIKIPSHCDRDTLLTMIASVPFYVTELNKREDTRVMMAR